MSLHSNDISCPITEQIQVKLGHLDFLNVYGGKIIECFAQLT